MEDIGEFLPSKLNTASYNFSLAIYNKNDKENSSIIYACDYDGESDQYKSLITESYDVVDFNKLTDKNSRFIFLGDFLNDEVFSVDVYGVMVFTGDVKNVVFNLKNKDARVVIDGRILNDTKINEYKN